MGGWLGSHETNSSEQYKNMHVVATFQPPIRNVAIFTGSGLLGAVENLSFRDNVLQQSRLVYICICIYTNLNRNSDTWTCTL